MTPFVSIVVLVHNGLSHAQTLLEDRRTQDVDAHWIAFDNGSDAPTASYLQSLKGQANLSVLRSDSNLYFARGNNEAAKEASGKYLLLLNSDVRINDPAWLSKLLAQHERGATGLGVHRNPLRADGFCFLIDRDLYGKGIDEAYDWWWGMTALQARVLREGYSVQAVSSYDEVTHFGGGSGQPPSNAKGMQTRRKTVRAWFKDLPSVRILPSLKQAPAVDLPSAAHSTLQAAPAPQRRLCQG